MSPRLTARTLFVLLLAPPVFALLCASAQAQNSVAMNCGSAAPGGSSNCGTLTVSSGSIYPERISSVTLPSASFTIGANSCQAGVSLIYNSCSLAISFTPGASAPSGPVSSAVTVSYTICAYDAAGNEQCNPMLSSKSVTITANVTTDPGQSQPTPVSLPATNTHKPAPGTVDESYLPNCTVNLSAQKFCVVEPLD